MSDFHPTRSLPPGYVPPQDHVTADPDPLATAGFTRATGPDTPVAVPGYDILEVLGRGGMGVVYKARDTRLNREVALKMVRAGDTPDPRAVIRFLAEAEAVAAIHHPHVVQVYEFGQTDGRPYFVMEYLPGGTLSERLRAGPEGSRRLSPADAAALVAKLAGAVQAAHDLQIIHRDLKPGNILFAGVRKQDSGVAEDAATLSDSALCPDPGFLNPKITDFGLAKRGGGEGGATDLTRTQAVMGTPSYMAPEQAEGRGKFVGPAADIYALGVVLYECLTGTVPFEDVSVMATLHRVVHDEPEAPRKRRPDLPRDLELICLKCLAKNPTERYNTATALAADLERFNRGEPVSVRAAGLLERSYKWARRNPSRAASIGFGTVAAVFAAVGVALWLAWTEAAEAGRKADDARLAAEAANAELIGAKDALEKAFAGEKAARGDLATALGTVSAERDRVRDLAKQQTDLNAKLEVAQRDLVRQGYFRSVDLAHRAILDGNPTRATQLLDQCPAEYRNWEWNYTHRKLNSAQLKIPVERNTFWKLDASRDGPWIATGGGDVRVWDLRTGTVVARQPNLPTSSLDFLTDGRLFARSTTDGGSMMWDPRTATWTKLPTLPHDKSFSGDVSPDGRWASTSSFGSDPFIVFDTATGKPALTFKSEKPDERNVIASTFSPDGSRIAISFSGKGVEVWDIAANKRLSTLTMPDVRLWYANSLIFRPDGRDLLINSDSNIRVFDAKTGEQKYAITATRGLQNGGIYTRDGGRFVIWDRSDLRLYDADKGLQLWSVPLSNPIDGVAIRPDGQRLAVWSKHTLRLHDAANGQVLQELFGHEGDIGSVVFASDGRLVTISNGHSLRVWDDRAADTFLPIDSLAVSDPTSAIGQTRGRLAIVGYVPTNPKKSVGLREGIGFWDTTTRSFVSSIPFTRGAAWASFTADDKHILVGTATGRITQWDTDNGKQSPTRYWVVSGQLTGVHIGRNLLAIADDRTEQVSVWDVSRVPERLVKGGRRFSPENAKKELPPEQWPLLRGSFSISGRIGALVFSPDGGHLLAVPFGKPGKVWEVETQKYWDTPTINAEGFRPLLTLTFPPIALGPGGERVVWQFRGELKVVDSRTGSEAVTLGWKGAALSNPMFSADGTKLHALTTGGMVTFDAAPRPPFVPQQFETAPPPHELKK